MDAKDKAKDLELWRKWKSTQSMHDLEALFLHMRPLLFREVNKWSSLVSPLVLEAEANKHTLEAFKTYDPNAGALLSTHVINKLMKLSRIAYSHQSTVSVPEHQRLSYNRLQRIKAQLEDQLGHTPTIEHLADHMGMSVAKVNALTANVGKRELMESGEGPVFQKQHDREAELIELAYSKLSPRQKDIYDLRTGSHGKPALGNPEIMKRLSLTQGVLSYEREKIVGIFKQLQNFA